MFTTAKPHCGFCGLTPAQTINRGFGPPNRTVLHKQVYLFLSKVDLQQEILIFLYSFVRYLCFVQKNAIVLLSTTQANDSCHLADVFWTIMNISSQFFGRIWKPFKLAKPLFSLMEKPKPRFGILQLNVNPDLGATRMRAPTGRRRVSSGSRGSEEPKRSRQIELAACRLKSSNISCG